MKVRAGSLPPTQLHRVDPIDFVLSDDEEADIRRAYDHAMRAPILRNQIAAEEADSSDDFGPINWASFRPLLAAVAVIFMALLVGWRLL